ncbi:hypothetical protein Tco_1321104 [Tanacetum coccineum]
MIQDTDEEPNEQELEAHYMYMVNIQEVLTAVDDYLRPTYDTEPLEKVDQNTEESEDEHALLASLIANLKLDVDENKKIEKQLKKANTTVTQELEKYKLDLKYCKIDLERESPSTFKMSRQSYSRNLVNVQFLQQLKPEWSRFVTIVAQQKNLDNVSYHTLFDILKKHQSEVNEIRAKRMARNANPLALVAAA